MNDCLVVFSSVEKLDELNANGIAEAAKNSIVDVLGKLKEIASCSSRLRTLRAP